MNLCFLSLANQEMYRQEKCPMSPGHCERTISGSMAILSPCTSSANINQGVVLTISRLDAPTPALPKEELQETNAERGICRSIQRENLSHSKPLCLPGHRELEPTLHITKV